MGFGSEVGLGLGSAVGLGLGSGIGLVGPEVDLSQPTVGPSPEHAPCPAQPRGQTAAIGSWLGLGAGVGVGVGVRVRVRLGLGLGLG